MSSLKLRKRLAPVIRTTILCAVLDCALLLGGCAYHPLLIPPDATPPGTAVVGGFIAGGGKAGWAATATLSPGVFDIGAHARLGVLPGVELGARGSLGGGALADVRLQPLRKPVSLSFDAAAFYNRGHLDPFDPHVPVPFTYRGLRPSVMVGVGRFYCGAACTLSQSWGVGYSGTPTNDTLVIPAAFAGVALGRTRNLLIDAELFQVRSGRSTDLGLSLGFAGYTRPLRLWGEPEPD